MLNFAKIFSYRKMKQVTYEGLTFEPYISHATIEARISELGRDIVRDCAGKSPLFVCVLNGAFPFASDLFRACEELDAEIAFIRLQSYQGTSSTGEVKQVLGLTDKIEDRTVIIIEDIVDTGTTIENLINHLQDGNPAEIKIATLLFKPEALTKDITPDYVGFSIPKKFIIGFGLDINKKGRNLNDIYILKED